MASLTLTAANSVFSIGVVGLFATPQTIQGYAADAMFEQEAVENAEFVFGADGQLSAGYVFNAKEQTVTLLPNSPSLYLFEQWSNAELVAQEKYPCFALITLPAVRRKYTLTNGYMRSMLPAISAGRILQPMPIRLTWEKIIGESY